MSILEQVMKNYLTCSPVLMGHAPINVDICYITVEIKNKKPPAIKSKLDLSLARIPRIL